MDVYCTDRSVASIVDRFGISMVKLGHDFSKLESDMVLQIFVRTQDAELESPRTYDHSTFNWSLIFSKSF